MITCLSAKAIAYNGEDWDRSLSRHFLNNAANIGCSCMSFFYTFLLVWEGCIEVLLPAAMAVAECVTLVYGGLAYAMVSRSLLERGLSFHFRVCLRKRNTKKIQPKKEIES
jgi:hypothetical protein